MSHAPPVLYYEAVRPWASIGFIGPAKYFGTYACYLKAVTGGEWPAGARRWPIGRRFPCMVLVTQTRAFVINARVFALPLCRKPVILERTSRPLVNIFYNKWHAATSWHYLFNWNGRLLFIPMCRPRPPHTFMDQEMADDLLIIGSSLGMPAIRVRGDTRPAKARTENLEICLVYITVAVQVRPQAVPGNR